MRCSGSRRRSWLIAGVIGAALANDSRAQPAAPVPAIDIQLTPGREPLRARVDLASRESAARYSVWLGPHQRTRLTITDEQDSTGEAVQIDLPWHPPAEAMAVEIEVAFELARSWWRSRFRDESDVIDGVARYLQGRIVEQLYELTYSRTGHSADTIAVFGGTLRWPLKSLRLSRWTAGLRTPEWRQGNYAEPALRIAVDLASFERRAGWPVLQGALFAAFNSDRNNQVPLAEIINAAAGHAVIEPTRAFTADDPAIAAVTQAPCNERPCVITRVTATRPAFRGRGPLPLRVDFADGTSVTAWWRDDEPSCDFAFESAAPYVSARIDPDRTLLSDTNLLNNAHFASRSSNVPTVKWLARWLSWLEDAMLAYTALV